MADVFLGEPSARIKQWIIDHSQPRPAGHPETRFTLQGGTVETHDITGTLDHQWMIANGYWNEDEGIWLKNITQVDIGNTVTSIGADAFYWNDWLASVTIPGTVMSIGNTAFAYCGTLTSVTIPDSVTSIMTDAFDGCIGLTSVTIVANGGNAENVKQMMINAGVSSDITWNMP